MSEDLEPIEKEKNPLETFYLPSSSGEVHRYYRKSEADKVIAEKDTTIAKLKQEIDRLKEENVMTLVGVNLRSPTSDGRLV